MCSRPKVDAFLIFNEASCKTKALDFWSKVGNFHAAADLQLFAIIAKLCLVCVKLRSVAWFLSGIVFAVPILESE